MGTHEGQLRHPTPADQSEGKTSPSIHRSKPGRDSNTVRRLVVGAADDPAERQADQIADLVVGNLHRSLDTQTTRIRRSQRGLDGGARHSMDEGVLSEDHAGAGRSRISLGGQAGEIGSVTLNSTGDGAVELTDLEVRGDHRGQGFGAKLVEAAARSSQQSGNSQVTLHSEDTGSGRLDNWYRRMGFEESDSSEPGHLGLTAPTSALLGGRIAPTTAPLDGQRRAATEPKVRRSAATGDPVIRRMRSSRSDRKKQYSKKDIKKNTKPQKNLDTTNYLADLGLADGEMRRVESFPLSGDAQWAQDSEKLNFDNLYGNDTWVMDTNFRDRDQVAKGGTAFYASDVVAHQAKVAQNVDSRADVVLPKYIVRKNVVSKGGVAFIDGRPELHNIPIVSGSEEYGELRTNVENVRSTEKIMAEFQGSVVSVRIVKKGDDNRYLVIEVTGPPPGKGRKKK